jgi:putative hemolysin
MKDGSFILNARIDIEDLNELLGTTFESEKVHTLGGLILDRLERIPAKGETFGMDGLKVQILEASKQRIFRVLVRKEGT